MSTRSTKRVLIIAGLMVGAACKPKGCTPEPAGDLVFSLPGSRLGGTNQVLASKKTVGTNNAWGAPALGASLAGTSLDSTPPFINMAITYSTTPSPIQGRRQQLDIFAEDLSLYIANLQGLLNNSGQWDQALNPCFTPGMLTLFYPTNATPPTGLPKNIIFKAQPIDWLPVQSSTFFEGCQGGIDTSVAGPAHLGSVQAAFEADRGLCATRGYASAIVPQIQQGLWSSFVSGLKQNGCADAQQPWFYASSYVSENPTLSPDLAPVGGFLMNFYFDAHIHIPFVDDENQYFNYQYQWMLTDGILSLSYARNGGQSSGGLNSGGDQATFEKALSDSVPPAIRTAALGQQAVDLFPPCCPGTYAQGNSCPPATANSVGDCTPDTGSDNPDNLVAFDGGECLGAVNAMNEALALAINDGTFASLGIDNNIGVPGSSLRPYDVLANTVLEPYPGNARLRHNWRCAVPTAEGGHNRCEYISRARRLNPDVDGFDLVWTDNPLAEIIVGQANGAPNSSNAAVVTSGLPLFILALDQGLNPKLGAPVCPGPAASNVPTAALAALCTPPSGASTASRYYANNFGNQSAGAFNVATCAGTVLGDIASNIYVQIVAGLNTFEFLGMSGGIVWLP